MLDSFGVAIFSPEEIEKPKRLEQINPRWGTDNNPKESDPEPARVVSDIQNDGALKTPAAGLSSMLASNPKIKAAQSEWEKKKQRELSVQVTYMRLTLPSTIPALHPRYI